ncbi:MAG: M20/M25/M40 family metallo-hydrolase, partial [Acidobacteriota bacterium]
MNHRLAVSCVAALCMFGVGTGAAAPEGAALARVEFTGSPQTIGVTVFMLLTDAARREYALVKEAPGTLAAAGLSFRVLDASLAPSGYLVGLERRTGARLEAAARYRLLLDDGRHVIVADAPGRADEMAALGLDMARVPHNPIAFRTVLGPVPTSITYDPRVAAMINSVSQTQVWNYNGNLSGENPVTVTGDPSPNTPIATRHTSSGVPIQRATQYVYDYLQGLGLQVSFHQWASGRNVIGAKPGSTRPGEIVLVTAHLDDMPSGGIAPGADDNASGSVGVMLAANAMSQFFFERTVRFVFFTGEEQGLLGADAYAAMVAAAGDNIVAVYNMDMIAWDSIGGPTLRLHTRTIGNPGYPADLAIANTFVDVTTLYGLSGGLTPILDPDGIGASDHAEFWQRGFPAILAIEDDVDDFCDYYHTVNDTRATLNMTYFTNYVKASVGTAAHLAAPSSAPCSTAVSPAALAADPRRVNGVTNSNGNGVFEPGETALLEPSWIFPANCSTPSMTGAVSLFAGPEAYTYEIRDALADYGAMVAGETANCNDKTGDCYLLKIGGGARPATHVDATVTEILNNGVERTWPLHLGLSFTDAWSSHWAYRHIETVLHHGITSGCSATEFCPAQEVSRWQMAVFIAKAMTGGA